MTKSIALLFVSLLLTGFVTYSPSGMQAEKQPSVQRAEKLVQDVSNLNLRKGAEKCWVDQREVRADIINNDTTVVASNRNVCEATQY